MRLKFLKSPTFLIAAPVILVVCLLEVAHLSIPQRVEWMFFDWRVKLAHSFANPPTDDAPNLGLVEISDNTVSLVKSDRLGFGYGLDWPRDVHAAGLKELSLEGAKAVAFDVLFAELREDHTPVTSEGTVKARTRFLPTRSSVPATSSSPPIRM